MRAFMVDLLILGALALLDDDPEGESIFETIEFKDGWPVVSCVYCHSCRRLRVPRWLAADSWDQQWPLHASG